MSNKKSRSYIVCCAFFICGLLVFCKPLAAQNAANVANPESELNKSSAGKVFRDSFALKDQNAPIFISSNSLQLDAQARLFTYLGDVSIQQGETVITADKVVGRYDENNAIEKITCEDNVVITKGADMRATSNRAVYAVAKGSIVLTEGPQVTHRGNALSADKITLFVNEDRSEAEGNVRVKVLKTDEGSQLSVKQLAAD